MAESSRTRLQQKIGGLVSTLNAEKLIAQGRGALASLDCQIVHGLAARHEEISALLRAPAPRVGELFDAAHEIRGIAGTFGYCQLGRIADALARYLSACAERGCDADPVVVLALSRALSASFVNDREGGGALANLAAGACALSDAKCADVRARPGRSNQKCG